MSTISVINYHVWAGRHSAYTFQGRKEEVKKYRCAFPLLSKLLSFCYIFEETHTQLSLNRHLYKADTWCWFLPFFLLFFFIYTLSRHTPFKTDNRHFWNRQRTLKKCSIEWKYLKNTSKQYTINCLFLLFCRLIPIRRLHTVTLLDL